MVGDEEVVSATPLIEDTVENAQLAQLEPSFLVASASFLGAIDIGTSSSGWDSCHDFNTFNNVLIVSKAKVLISLRLTLKTF
jgi:hypothetical protein